MRFPAILTLLARSVASLRPRRSRRRPAAPPAGEPGHRHPCRHPARPARPAAAAQRQHHRPRRPDRGGAGRLRRRCPRAARLIDLSRPLRAARADRQPRPSRHRTGPASKASSPSCTDSVAAARLRGRLERPQDARRRLHHGPQPRLGRRRHAGPARRDRARLGDRAADRRRRHRRSRRPPAIWTPTLGIREEFHDDPAPLGQRPATAPTIAAAPSAARSRAASTSSRSPPPAASTAASASASARRCSRTRRARSSRPRTSTASKVAVHAHGADGINLALRVGADSIEHGTLLDDESIRLFRQTGAYYVPTLSTVNGYLERLRANPNAYTRRGAARRSNGGSAITGQALRRAVPAGVRIAFGTDAGVSMHGRNADEFLLMVQHGMTPMAAISGRDRQRRRSARPRRRGRHDRARQERRHRRGARRSARRCRRAAADELRDGPRPRPPTGAVRSSNRLDAIRRPPG